METIESNSQSSVQPSKEIQLWQSPLGHTSFIISVIIILLLTILKFASSLSFITACYKTSDNKVISYDLFNLILYGTWIILPPLVFLVEYVFIFGKDKKRRLDPLQCADIKYCHDLASKVWAGVSVFLGILLLLKYGIKF